MTLNLLNKYETAKGLAPMPFLTLKHLKRRCVMAHQQLSFNSLKIKPENGCMVVGCGKKHEARGYCTRHYKQLRKHGVIVSNEQKICSVIGCTGKYKAKGYCSRHYSKALRLMEVGVTKKTCMVSNCDGFCESMGYCSKHYAQIKTHGKILNRTTKDPNEFIFSENTCMVIIYNLMCEKIAIAIIDRSDFSLIKDIKWSLANGYARSGNMYMHNVILGNTPTGLTPDHKNRNRLDNRKSNLRFCTVAENLRNSGAGKNNTSGFKGVSWVKRDMVWRARIFVDNKELNCGHFDNKIEAAKAYNVAASRHFGEFACLNQIPQKGDT